MRVLAECNQKDKPLENLKCSACPAGKTVQMYAPPRPRWGQPPTGKTFFCEFVAATLSIPHFSDSEPLLLQFASHAKAGHLAKQPTHHACSVPGANRQSSRRE